MIVHMVLLKIRPDVPAKKVAEAFAAIGALQEKIPCITS